MPNRFFRKIRKSIQRRYRDIDPEDIFLDSANLPGFDKERFQGRIEEPIGESTFSLFKLTFLIIVVALFVRLVNLQAVHGATYEKISDNNSLHSSLIFANRGVIYDRNGVVLASNAVREADTDFAARVYTSMPGFAHVLGYLKYPSMDSAGFYYDENYHGRDGVEKIYNDALSGTNGLQISETDAHGHIVSESVVDKPVDGKPLYLSLDAGVTQEMYKAMQNIAEERGFSGGAGVIMDINTGEILAITSYPEFNANVVTDGRDSKAISALLKDPSKPFLDRAVSGLYTPGSIVKPIVALGALNENVIDPLKKILSIGYISVPNPYDPAHPSIFKDWRPQGWIDMKGALAVSSDVYFYEVGGGFQDQPGLGISNIDKYFQLFGLNTKTGIDLPGESQGNISTPAWKADNFDGEAWLLGDTYHTAIGQYGTQVTPLEAVRWVAALANGGKLLVPSVVLGGKQGNALVSGNINLPEEDFQIVRDGMRQAVTQGIATALNLPYVSVAAKSGTAELGVAKVRVNSWITGFFPYEHPRYAFAVIMESGPRANTIGGTYVMRQVLDWMASSTPEYFK